MTHLFRRFFNVIFWIAFLWLLALLAGPGILMILLFCATFGFVGGFAAKKLLNRQANH